MRSRPPTSPPSRRAARPRSGSRCSTSDGDVEREHELLLQIEDALGSATQALLGSGALPPLSEMDGLRAALTPS